MKSFNRLHLPDFTIYQPAVPQASPKVPAGAVTAEKLVLRAERSEGIVEHARPREAVEEVEFEEVADAEVGEGAEVSQGKWDWSRVEQVEQFFFYPIHVACEIPQAYPQQ